MQEYEAVVNIYNSSKPQYLRLRRYYEFSIQIALSTFVCVEFVHTQCTFFAHPFVVHSFLCAAKTHRVLEGGCVWPAKLIENNVTLQIVLVNLSSLGCLFSSSSPINISCKHQRQSLARKRKERTEGRERGFVRGKTSSSATSYNGVQPPNRADSTQPKRG